MKKMIMGTCVHSVDVRHLKNATGCRGAGRRLNAVRTPATSAHVSARQHNFQVSSVAELVVERTFTCTAVIEGERWMWM